MIIRILRCENSESESRWEDYDFEPDAGEVTLAMALDEINLSLGDDKIEWECSCQQKKCGACAMVIDGKPQLACDFYLDKRQKLITVEPLRKFPVIKDLRVDRSILRRQLLNIEAWQTKQAHVNKKNLDIAYDSALCMQCGICLELCPNYYAEGDFYGTAAAAPAAGIIAVDTDNSDIRVNYEAHVFEGCAKSLSCRNNCPAGIDVDGLLAHSNWQAVWRKRKCS